jgi:histidine ammonia-lyase
VADLHAAFRAKVAFLGKDRALDGDVAAAVDFVEALLAR